jgi:hypothetical protein
MQIHLLYPIELSTLISFQVYIHTYIHTYIYTTCIHTCIHTYKYVNGHYHYITSGGVTGAAAGTLTFMVGGEESTLARVTVTPIHTVHIAYDFRIIEPQRLLV